MRRPPHAYIPGRTPRHPEGAFDALRASARPGMGPRELARSAAFRTGLVWLESGYFWEAHELLEPVWMALPEGSRERELVQGLIQLANARLKERMQRPRAAERLRAMARAHFQAAGQGPVMGLEPEALLREVEQ